MARSRWYEGDPIMGHGPWTLLAAFIGIVGVLILKYWAGAWVNISWKEEAVTLVFVLFYVEFDASTRQIEKLMDRVKELERTRV